MVSYNKHYYCHINYFILFYLIFYFYFCSFHLISFNCIVFFVNCRVNVGILLTPLSKGANVPFQSSLNKHTYIHTYICAPTFWFGGWGQPELGIPSQDFGPWGEGVKFSTRGGVS